MPTPDAIDLPAAPPPLAAPPGPPGPRIAVIGAGPVGLALALLARARCPGWSIDVFDSRPAEKDLRGDPRTLALSLGSVQLLERLGVWPQAAAEPIREVHVSQAAAPLLSTLAAWAGQADLAAPAVHLRAADQGVPQLGAVLGYGALLAPLQAAFLAGCARDALPSGDDSAAASGLRARLGTPVADAVDDGSGAARVRLADGREERFDVVVVAEGGVFADQARKAISHDYRQTAWIGRVVLEGAVPGRAIERFTRDGPLALLPLPAIADPGAVAGAGAGTDGLPPLAARQSRAALVWCAATDADEVATLDTLQRIAVLNTRLPEAAGRVVALTPLKSFALGLNAETRPASQRVLRIGNAAQTLHPVAGQGLNLGLRDAYRLVDRFVAAGPSPDAPTLARALRRTGAARAPDRWSMILATDFLARSFTWQAPGVADLRAMGMAAVQALPPVKRALARQFMFGWR